ncbi:sugar phosphate permease [Silvibacterium bohemicum]|uniref:Sugar phosphate permease n=1 Tax=Silvibacterium bohemicum TaxID=1577686 RepID=A0A841JMT3_9BACT|nr:MFS transporter [Silvibacterium bohemicum]MBB6142682.1 sugar phosphate permease [Silvibacterium bohemicum]
MSRQNLSNAAWPSRLYSGAWLLYAGYYICRKDLGSVAGSAATHLATELACFGVAYAIAQFVGGELADRFSARRVALAGSALSILCTAALAIASPKMILLLQVGNGFGQGFGWPALLQLFGRWFGRGERDHVLGWWSTSYILGGFLATSLAMWLTIHTAATTHSGFEPAYLIISGILLLAALLFYFQTRGMPEARTAEDAQSGFSASSGQSWRRVLGDRNIRYISAMYFFLKMTRYTLLFWLPLYLVSSGGYTNWSAAHIASCFEILGIAGPIAVGYVIERWLVGRHMQLGAIMLYALAFVCLLHPLLAGTGTLGMVISISLMGMLIHGSDLLMSGMAVLDTVPSYIHGRSIGFVNGIGSIGQAISPLLATLFVAHYGWSRLFDLFVFFAIVAGIICTLGARSLTGNASPVNRSALKLSDIPL